MSTPRLCTIQFPRHPTRTQPGELSAVFQRGKLWSVGDTITISFLNPTYTGLEWEYSLDQIASLVPESEMQIERDAREAAKTSYADAFKLVIMSRVAPVVPTLTFKFVPSNGDVVVRFMAEGGSSSTVGTDCKLHQSDFTLTLGWLDVGTMIHEFAHALGMLHEAESPNVAIPWNRDAVINYYQTTQSPPWTVEEIEANVLNPVNASTVFASKYDPDSVMLYFFPPELTTDGKGTKQNFRFSATDIAWLRQQYDVKTPLHPSLVPSSSPSSAAVQRSMWFAPIVLGILLLLIIVFGMRRK